MRLMLLLSLLLGVTMTTHVDGLMPWLKTREISELKEAAFVEDIYVDAVAGGPDCILVSYATTNETNTNKYQVVLFVDGVEQASKEQSSRRGQFAGWVNTSLVDNVHLHEHEHRVDVLMMLNTEKIVYGRGSAKAFLPPKPSPEEWLKGPHINIYSPEDNKEIPIFTHIFSLMYPWKGGSVAFQFEVVNFELGEEQGAWAMYGDGHYIESQSQGPLFIDTFASCAHNWHRLQILLLGPNDDPKGISSTVNFFCVTPPWYWNIVLGPAVGAMSAEWQLDSGESLWLHKAIMERLANFPAATPMLRNDENLCLLANRSVEESLSGLLRIDYKLHPFPKGVWNEVFRDEMFPVMNEQFNWELSVTDCRVRFPAVSVAVLLHLGSPKDWKWFSERLQHVKKFTTVDLWVNIVSDKGVSTSELVEVQDEILAENGNARIIFSPNQGRDVGGYLRLLKEMLSHGQEEYDLLLFLHSKTNLIGRAIMVDPLIGTEDKVKRAVDLFASRPDVGMLFSAKDELNPKYSSAATFLDGNIRNYTTQFGMTDQLWSPFALGTCFWVRAGIYNSFFEQKHIDLDQVIADLKHEGEDGDYDAPHAWERFFGYIIHASSYSLIGVEE